MKCLGAACRRLSATGLLLLCLVTPQVLSATDWAHLEPVDFDGWEQVLAGERGHVVVVDLWASWCVSCIERFPHMVEMSRRYRDRGVQFLSLNLDEPGDLVSLKWADEFLEGMDAGFPHYHLDENLMQSFERLDLMALPVVLMYDRAGTEVKRLTQDDPNRQFDEDDVEAAIESLTTATKTEG